MAGGGDLGGQQETEQEPQESDMTMSGGQWRRRRNNQIRERQRGEAGGEPGPGSEGNHRMTGQSSKPRGFHNRGQSPVPLPVWFSLFVLLERRFPGQVSSGASHTLIEKGVELRIAVLKFASTSEAPAGLGKTPIAGPHFQDFSFSQSRVAENVSF